jgi:putative ABC transport system ATP-binding protein
LIHELPEGRMAVWRGRNMGVVFQFFQLLPMLSLVENDAADGFLQYLPPPAVKRAPWSPEAVGLEGLAHKLPGAVAGGHQQSAAVARALANDPPILIADEPTGNLDSRTAEQVMGIFAELVEQGKTVVMVTHDPILARRTSRTLLISDGELVNEAVAAAFPGHSHSALLRLSKLAAQVHLLPVRNCQLPRSGSAPLYLLVSGELLYPLDCPGLPHTPGAVVDPLAGSQVGLFAGPSGAGLLSLPRTEVLPLLHPAGDSLLPGIQHSAGGQAQGRLHLPGRDS